MLTVALFAAFTENVAPMVHIFHMPTLNRLYWNAIASPDSVDKNTETLLFAIHYSTIISIGAEQCMNILGVVREVALKKYRFAVQQALAKGDLLNTQNMTMLQAIVLFLTALCNQDETRTTWSLTALAYHIAQAMGLHRDGTVFGLKPFETELRRRLWWHICVLDSRSSEYHGYMPIVSESAFDTRPPLHINDADLLPGMTQPPVERWDEATDMTFSLIRCEAIKTGWKLRQARESHRGSAAPDGDRVPVEYCNRLVQELQQNLEQKFVRHCDNSVPVWVVSSAAARLIAARLWLVVQHPLVIGMEEGRNGSDDGQKATNPESGSNRPRIPSDLNQLTREKLFQTTIEILELSSLFMTNKDIAHWAWYSKTHIQWGAVAFVLSELCSRPPSPNCDRAWACVTTVYEEWKMREDKSRGTLWRSITQLMAKARYMREIQQTGTYQREGRTRHNNQQHQQDRRPCRILPATGLSLYRSSHAVEHTSSKSAFPFTSSFFQTPDSFPFQDVFPTETLDPFMDPLPDYLEAEVDGDFATLMSRGNYSFV